MRISIITCTLDAEEWLADNIVSIATQRYADFEQIFVDGGSSDATLELIARAPHRTTLIPRVQGIPAALNTGVAAATGEVVMFVHQACLDGGDALACIAAAFDRRRCSWLYGQCRDVLDDGTEVSRPAPPWDPRRLRTRGNMVPLPAVAIRRSLLLEAGGFDAMLHHHADYDLWLRLAQITRPGVIGDFVARRSPRTRYPAPAERRQYLLEERELRLRHARGALERTVARLSLWRKTRRQPLQPSADGYETAHA